MVAPDGVQYLTRRGHTHDHRAASVQVDPDVLFTHGASLVVAGVNGPSVQHSPNPGRRARRNRNTCQQHDLTGQWTHFLRACPADGASKSVSVVALETSV